MLSEFFPIVKQEVQHALQHTNIRRRSDFVLRKYVKRVHTYMDAEARPPLGAYRPGDAQDPRELCRRSIIELDCMALIRHLVDTQSLPMHRWIRDNFSYRHRNW